METLWEGAGLPERVRIDLARFDLAAMLECGRALREASEDAGSMEGAANAVVRTFYDCLVEEQTGERNLVLARCFKTQRYRRLPGDLAAIARGVLGPEAGVDPEMPALTLLATAGELPKWNDRRASQGHAAIPLVSVEMVERAPMIAALLRQMGIAIGAAMSPSAQVLWDADLHAFDVFHVEHAMGDARIPAQAEFVVPFGVQSVLGFGGLLPSGELFAVILFSRVHVSAETAVLFRTIALGVKLALLPFTRGPIFERRDVELVRSVGNQEGPLPEAVGERANSENATQRLLIKALEKATLARLRS